MRIALISDIHGNMVALSAVLEDIQAKNVDKILCLGDVATLGPEPNAVINMLKKLRCPCIMGNHDAFMLDSELIKKYTELELISKAVDWCRAKLSPESFNYIQTLLPDYTLPLCDDGSLYAFHGTPQSNTGILLATTAPNDLDDIFEGICASVFVGGHTHFPFVKRHRDMLIVNPGSTGSPFKDFADAPVLFEYAEYAVIEADEKGIHVEMRRVRLNMDALVEAVKDCDNPICGWLLKEYSRMS